MQIGYIIWYQHSFYPALLHGRIGCCLGFESEYVPIIIPPVIIEQYNQTPLMGIQALSLTDSNVANTLIKRMVGCGLVDLDNITFGDFSDFNKK